MGIFSVKITLHG